MRSSMQDLSTHSPCLFTVLSDRSQAGDRRESIRLLELDGTTEGVGDTGAPDRTKSTGFSRLIHLFGTKRI